MTYEIVKDILHRVCNFHNQINDYYYQLYSIADKDRLRLLLDYMSRHEKYMEKCISEYKDDAPKQILYKWIKYTPVSTYRECFEATELNQDMSIDEVINVALRLDDCLINAYKTIVESTESSKIKELFKSLLSSEGKESRKLVNEYLELKDLSNSKNNNSEKNLSSPMGLVFQPNGNGKTRKKESS